MRKFSRSLTTINTPPYFQSPNLYFIPQHPFCPQYLAIAMEVSELVSRTKQCSFHDIHLKLPLNQDPQSNLDSTLIGKLISTKPLGLNIVKAVVTKAWQPVYPLEVRKLEYNIFPFRFQHEADSQQAFQRQP